MAIKERKQRAKEQFRRDLIEAAYGLIRVGGLEALTLRKLAGVLEYSTTKLYHELGDKQVILELLAEDILRRQTARMASLSLTGDPEERLMAVTLEAVRFYSEEPWSGEVLLSVRFGGGGGENPAAFQEAAEFYRGHVAALQLPALASAEALEAGQNVTRALMIGALSILRVDASQPTKDLVLKIMDDGMRLIIAGWKARG